MAKGTKKAVDMRKASEPIKAEETDTLSPVDKGLDFVKAGETAHISHSYKD